MEEKQLEKRRGSMTGGQPGGSGSTPVEGIQQKTGHMDATRPSCQRHGGGYIREGGMPERINRTTLGTMMVRGPLHDGIVLFRSVALRPNLVG